MRISLPQTLQCHQRRCLFSTSEKELSLASNSLTAAMTVAYLPFDNKRRYLSTLCQVIRILPQLSLYRFQNSSSLEKKEDEIWITMKQWLSLNANAMRKQRPWRSPRLLTNSCRNGLKYSENNLTWSNVFMLQTCLILPF